MGRDRTFRAGDPSDVPTLLTRSGPLRWIRAHHGTVRLAVSIRDTVPAAEGRFKMRRTGSVVAIAITAVLALATQAMAAVTFGSQSNKLGTPYSWNYSNTLDSTGTGGTLKLHHLYASDNTLPQAVFYNHSADGTT